MLRKWIEERERSMDGSSSSMYPTRDKTCNPGKCLDQELNRQYSGAQDDAQPN